MFVIQAEKLFSFKLQWVGPNGPVPLIAERSLEKLIAVVGPHGRGGAIVTTTDW